MSERMERIDTIDINKNIDSKVSEKTRVQFGLKFYILDRSMKCHFFSFLLEQFFADLIIDLKHAKMSIFWYKYIEMIKIKFKSCFCKFHNFRLEQ